jgi:hypothetical protein
MSDTAPRNPAGAPQMLADALLRSMTGSTALLKVAVTNTDSSQNELGIAATTFNEVAVGPAVMRKMRPTWQGSDETKWELLISATGIEQQVNSLDLTSAQALFDITLTITVACKDYLIESISCNEAFGQPYLYRLLLREAHKQTV